jgi:hypothetical protein
MKRPDLVRFQVKQCSGFTDPHTLRSATAEVALESPPNFFIEPHGAERTCSKAHLASDTAIISDRDLASVVREDSFCGADVEARGI